MVYVYVRWTAHWILETQKFSNNNCGVVGKDRTRIVWQLGMAFMTLGLVAYAFRCLEKLRTSAWGLDDWAISLVVMILIPMCVVTIPRTFITGTLPQQHLGS